MDPSLCETIQNEHAKRCQWNQSLLLKLNDNTEATLDLSCSVIKNAFTSKKDTEESSLDNLGTSTSKPGINISSPTTCPPCMEDHLDLSRCVGKDAVTPIHATDQPFPGLYPHSSVFRFPIKFRGAGAVDDIKKLLERGCAGCELFSQKDHHGLNNNRYELRCKRYNVQKVSNEEDFVPGKFSKQNTKTESIKIQRSKNGEPAIKRMKNNKMKSQVKGLNPTDRRGSKSATKLDKANSQKKRTQSNLAESKETKCQMNIQFFMCPHLGYWYLNQKSNLQHSFHAPVDPNGSLLNKDNLNQTQMDMISEMYNVGIPASSIAEIMSNLVNKEGKSGEFIASTIRNITNDMQKAMDTISKVSSDWSLAKKTMEQLNACVLLYI